eukprot:4318906-Prorocentrum_lima.AAC.1
MGPGGSAAVAMALLGVLAAGGPELCYLRGVVECWFKQVFVATDKRLWLQTTWTAAQNKWKKG